MTAFSSRPGEPWDIEKWMREHGVPFADAEPYDGGQRWKLRVCPFNAEHTKGSAVIGRKRSGQVWFKCQHGGCAGKSWQDARQQYEPGWKASTPTANHKDGPFAVGSYSSQSVGFIDAADLAASGEDDELDYLPLLGREGYIVRGLSHLVSGYPRVGKTELLSALLHAWVGDGNSVLLFTEESKQIWRYRLRQFVDAQQTKPRMDGVIGSRLGFEAWRGLRLVFGLGMDPAVLLSEARRASEPVVVVDAIRNLLQFTDEKDNSEVARRINPWVVMGQEMQKTLVLTHHNRKAAGDHGEGIAGGHALLGAVDIALEVVRDPNQAANRRKIRAYARLIQPAELLYEMTAAGWLQALGDPKAVSRNEVEQRVMHLLTRDWQYTTTILSALDEPVPSRRQLQIALSSLARTGFIERDPSLDHSDIEGKRLRWRIADQHDGCPVCGRPQAEGALCSECERLAVIA